MISMAMLHDAQRVLKPVINRTPVIQTKGIVPGCDFYLKADCLQKTGAFKLRGAYYKIATLSDEEKERGVIACSAGNHAQGVAYAARDMGIRATICIPEGAPLSKIEATRSYGANVVLVPGVYDDAYAEAVRLRDEQGLTFIHPFNDYRVMAGQGTIGLEILEQLPDVDMIFVPIGGGGLIAGLAYAVKSLKPDCRVIGVQAAGAPSMAESLREGKIITLSSVDTVADGIKVKTPGDLTFEMCRQYVDEVVTVSEGEIASAILTVLEKQKLVAEGAGAVGIAAAMYHKVNTEGRRVCALLSGGNVDVTMLERILTRGLAKEGRTVSLATVRPGLVPGGGVLSGCQRAGCEPRAAQHTGGHWLMCGERIVGDPGQGPYPGDLHLPPPQGLRGGGTVNAKREDGHSRLPFLRQATQSAGRRV